MREREASETERKEVFAKCQFFPLSVWPSEPSVVPGALLIGLSYSPDHPLTWRDLEEVGVRGSLWVAENIAGGG